MRLPPAALALALLLPAAAGAEEPPTVVVKVGEKVTIGGYAGRCDDLSIATITLDADATITGLKVGSTICSSQRAGGRKVYRVEVRAPAPGGPRPGQPRPGPSKET
jgi:hypothetical protein